MEEIGLVEEWEQKGQDSSNNNKCSDLIACIEVLSQEPVSRELAVLLASGLARSRGLRWPDGQRFVFSEFMLLQILKHWNLAVGEIDHILPQKQFPFGLARIVRTTCKAWCMLKTYRGR